MYSLDAVFASSAIFIVIKVTVISPHIMVKASISFIVVSNDGFFIVSPYASVAYCDGCRVVDLVDEVVDCSVWDFGPFSCVASDCSVVGADWFFAGEFSDCACWVVFDPASGVA